MKRKAIKRSHAEEYLLIILISFAFSVSATRLFLELTNYPQLGGGELHIAHVLWGGLLLFCGSLFPLIFANRWSFRISALLAGIGMGLFIDEVGKFITSSNDYFYPSAAPIVYAMFLITFFLYFQIRKPKVEDPRTYMYSILSDLEEMVDRDLSADERMDILQNIKLFEENSQEIDMLRFNLSLKEFLTSDEIQLVTHKPDLIESLKNKWISFEARWLKKQRFSALLAGGLIAWGLYAVLSPLEILLSIRNPEEFSTLLNNLISSNLICNITGLNWFEARVGLEGSLGVIIFISGIFLLLGKDRRGIDLAFSALLIMLCIVNLLLFYFDQFSTIINASFQFILLIGILRYRQRFLSWSR